MSSRLLSLSLGLNLVLLGLVGYHVVKSHSSDGTPVAAEVLQPDHETDSDKSVIAVPGPAPLRWSELESKDYQTYVANLRKAGCPEPVLRRIIGAELRELYARKAFALVQKFHHDFWEIATAEDVQEYFEKRLQKQAEALCKEPDALLNQLVGGVPRDASTAKVNLNDSRIVDFLSPAKQEQLRRLAERYEVLQRTVRQGDLSPEEKANQQAQLRREMESEQAQILSPEELAEYQLRQSDAAAEVQQLYGVNFSEAELHNLAKIIDQYNRRAAREVETDSETLEQALQTVLGPQRFAELNRARSASFRDLYELAAEFGRPKEAAAEIFDLRLQSEKQCDAIRADKNRSPQEKQALLDDLEEQVEQNVITKLGTEGYQSYKATGGRWINSLGRL